MLIELTKMIVTLSRYNWDKQGDNGRVNNIARDFCRLTECLIVTVN